MICHKRIIKPSLTIPKKRDVNEDHEWKMTCNFFRISFAMLGCLWRPNKSMEVLELFQIPWRYLFTLVQLHWLSLYILKLFKSRDMDHDIPNGFWISCLVSHLPWSALYPIMHQFFVLVVYPNPLVHAQGIGYIFCRLH